MTFVRAYNVIKVFYVFPVLKWLMASAGRSFSTAVPEQLQLLPLLFKVGGSRKEDTWRGTRLKGGGLSLIPLHSLPVVDRSGGK